MPQARRQRRIDPSRAGHREFAGNVLPHLARGTLLRPRPVGRRDANIKSDAPTTTRGENEATNAPGSSSFSQAPAISLPKGGGAIRGIGEKFAANPVTGTGSMTVPIAASPGRSGFGPQLALSYDSDDGEAPIRNLRLSVDAPPRSRLIHCLLPDGDIFLLKSPPAKNSLPLILLHSPVF